MPQTVSTTAGRLVRPAVVCVLLLAALLAGVPAQAAGTGGIEVTPVPAQRDGKPVTSFKVDVPSDGDTEVRFLLRNVEDGTRSARVFAAPVRRNGDGFVLGDAGGSPWVALQDEEVTLAKGESQERTFTVKGGDLPSDEVLAAVVVQVQNGAVVQRASTLIYLSRGRQVPLPLLAVLAAVAVLLLAGGAFLLAQRRRKNDEDPAPDERETGPSYA